MKKIRIQNDITLRIAVTRLGSEEDFTGKTLSLLLRSVLATVKLDYTISDNTLTAIWYGTEQQRTGTYTVTLVEDYGEKSRNTVDSCGVFALVSRSCDESDVLTGDQIIDLDLDISVPGNGLSAYEIALINGYEGTQEEWMQTLTEEASAYAQTEGDYAKTQGDYAKEQGDYAKSEGDKVAANLAYVAELKETVDNSIEVSEDTAEGTLTVVWTDGDADYTQDTDSGTITVAK